jgi:F-type H+-transporting ATPase subunit gamma
MPSAREMRLRIRSVRNISQVTRALQAVSASKVRRAMSAVMATRPYAEKAWKVILHLARQPGSASLHPLLKERSTVRQVLVLMVSGDRGLAGAYNVNIVRHTLQYFDRIEKPVHYISVGRKGRDMLIRRRKNIIAEFSNLPPNPSFSDVSAIGKLAIDEYIRGRFDQVFIAYTDFINLIKQETVIRKLLPLEVGFDSSQVQKYNVTHPTHSVFTYEPDQNEVLEVVTQRFTAIQIYQAILDSLASEHAARMIAMRNATENAQELGSILQNDYNRARQQAITSEMLDISSGAEAMEKILSHQV